MTTVNVVNTRAAGVELVVDVQDYSSSRYPDGSQRQPLVKHVMLKPGPNEIDSTDLGLFRTNANVERLFALGTLKVSNAPAPMPLVDPATTHGTLAGVETLPPRVAQRAIASCSDVRELEELQWRDRRAPILKAITDRLHDLWLNPDWRFR